jgi:imidazolonepropionase-like amidohydrolase
LKINLPSLLAVALVTSSALPTALPAAEPPSLRADAEARGHLAVEVLPNEPTPKVILRGGTVLTAAGQRHEPGYVVIVDGRIQAVGPGEPPAVADVRVIDVSGKFVTPGMIDAHSHLGVYPAPGFKAHSDGNEATSPATGGVWAEHALWPQDPGIELAVAGGTTAMLVLPGSANLIGGRGVTVQAVPGRGSRAMRFPGAPDLLKIACGENPKRVYGEKGGPATRMGNVRGHREAFLAAQKYREEWQRWEKKQSTQKAPPRSKPKGSASTEEPAPPPARDLNLETLVEVLEGRILVQAHCYRADDMLNLIQVADEMGFKIHAFHHALEAYKIRDILAAREIAVATWADWWGFKMEAFDGIEQNAALLSQSGVRAVIKSDSPIDIQRLNQEAGKALAAAQRAGIPLSEDEALRFVTAYPAWALGIEAEVGTLEAGKRADVVVWDQHPFSVYAHARLVFIDGRLRYDRDRRGKPWSDFMLGQEIEP